MADSSLRLNVIMGMVDRITSPMQKVTSQTERMSDEVKASQNELERLGGLSKDIEHFRKLKRGVSDTTKEMTEAQQRVDALARQMREAGAPSKSLTRDFNKAKREVDQLRQAHDRENRELEETRRRLNDAGVSTKNLNDATRKIREETRRYNDDLEQQQQAMADVANRQQRMAELQERNSNMRRGALVDTAKLTAGVFAVTRFTNAYGELANAQGEIASLGIGAEGVDAITRAAKDFSNQWAGTTAPEFVSASYDIKSGIASLSDEAVGEFTRIAALTGAATKSTTDQMTSLFATGYGIYRDQFGQLATDTVDGWQQMSAAERDMQFGEYFSAGIASAVQAYKTNGSEMSSAISSLGATATSANVPFSEQLAILGKLQQTMSGSEASTKYRAFLTNAAKASDDLGLSFMDANNQLLSMPEILDELRGKYGDTIDAVEEQELKKAFGTEEAVAAIKLLYDGTDELREGVTSLEEAMGEGMSTTQAMAQAMQEGPSKATEIMMQRIQNATAQLGQAFAPVVIAVAGALGSAATVVADLSERFPGLSTGVALVIAGLMGLMAASIVGRFAFAGLSDAIIFGTKAFNFLRLSTIKANLALVATRTRSIAATAGVVAMGIANKAAAAGTAVMTGAQWALNAAMSANPIGLIIAGIVALVAVVALVYRYWGPLSEFFAGLWESIKTVFAAGWEYIKAGLSAAWDVVKGLLSFSPLSLLAPLWEPLGAFFAGVWGAITAPWVAGWQLITDWLGFDPLAIVAEAWSPLIDFYVGLWKRVMGIFGQALDWIGSKVMDPINGIKDALGGVWNSLFGDGDAGVEVTQRVAQVSEATPPDLRGSAPSPSSGEAAGSAGVLGAPVGSVAASSGGTTVVDQSQHRTEVSVQQQPGQSAEDVGVEVRRQLDERDRENRRRNRARLSD